MLASYEFTLKLEAEVMEGCHTDIHAVQIQDLKPTICSGRLPSLRTLKLRRGAPHAALGVAQEILREVHQEVPPEVTHQVTQEPMRQPKAVEEDSNNNRNEDVGGHKFAGLPAEQESSAIKAQGNTLHTFSWTNAKVPTSTILAGAASLGLRRRSKATSAPPMKLFGKLAEVRGAINSQPPASENIEPCMMNKARPQAKQVQDQPTGLIPRPPTIPPAHAQPRRQFNNYHKIKCSLLVSHAFGQSTSVTPSA